MTPSEKGRFCALCQKNVVDFTDMNDKGMLYFLQENPNTCGRFRKTQLNRQYIPPIQRQVSHSPYTTLAKWKNN